MLLAQLAHRGQAVAGAQAAALDGLRQLARDAVVERVAGVDGGVHGAELWPSAGRCDRYRSRELSPIQMASVTSVLLQFGQAWMWSRRGRNRNTECPATHRLRRPPWFASHPPSPSSSAKARSSPGTRRRPGCAWCRAGSGSPSATTWSTTSCTTASASSCGAATALLIGAEQDVWLRFERDAVVARLAVGPVAQAHQASHPGRYSRRVSKPKSVYTCNECGGTSPKWLGKCPHCNAWNTLVEGVAEAPSQAPLPVARRRAAGGHAVRDRGL